MDANISKLKLLGTRLIAGVLTASMLLSTVTTAVAAGIGASTAPDSVVEEDPNKGAGEAFGRPPRGSAAFIGRIPGCAGRAPSGA